MRGAIINERNSRAVSMGIAVGRQHGLSTLDALMDELCRARAARHAMMAELKAEFERQILALQRQLAEAQRELRELKTLDELSRWQPDTTTLN